MQRKLKGLFRKSDSHKTNHEEPLEPEANPPSLVVGGTESAQAETRFSSIESIPERGRSKSVLSQHDDSRMDGPVKKRNTDNSLRDNVPHQQYLPAMDQSGVIATNSATTSLGGDPRLVPDAKIMSRYGEDVANRNLERSAVEHDAAMSHSSPTDSSRGSSTKDKRMSLGRESVGSQTLSKEISSELTPQSAANGNGEGYMRSNTPTRKPVPTRVARDESHMQQRRRRGSQGEEDNDAPQASDYGPRFTKQDLVSPVSTENPHSRPSAFDGADEARGREEQTDRSIHKADVNEIVDTRVSVDVDLQRTWSPAVTHERIKPIEHEIKQERVYRDIHNHDVYHRIQPIHETEILAPKHFVQDPATGVLTEVPQDQVPERWKEKASQRWHIGEKKLTTTAEFPPPQARLTEPKVVSEKTYMTPEGFERKESVILHPSTLEDMSAYKGPVQPIEFCHHGQEDHKEQNPEKMEGVTHNLQEQNHDEKGNVAQQKLEEMDGVTPNLQEPEQKLEKRDNITQQNLHPLPRQSSSYYGSEIASGAITPARDFPGSFPNVDGSAEHSKTGTATLTAPPRIKSLGHIPDF